MKKILLILCAQFALTAGVLQAQTFTASDTVRQTIVGAATINNPINNISGGSITIKWNVIATDFPADWRADTAFGICDNQLCRGNASGALWNGTSGTQYTSAPYPAGTGAFSLAMNLTGASAGSHYVTVRLSDMGLPPYSKDVTFVINKFPTAVTSVNNADHEVTLYPNPAADEVNVLFNPNADIKTVAVYNVIGKVMSVYKVNGSSANLNISNMPSGIYFVRMANSHGDVIVTRKFTKQ